MENDPPSGADSVPLAQPSPIEFWRGFGFDTQAVVPFGIKTTLPKGVIAFAAPPSKKSELISVVKRIPYDPKLVTHTYSETAYFYQFDPEKELGQFGLPEGVKLYVEGRSIHLPDDRDFRPEKYEARTIADLPLIAPEDLPDGVHVAAAPIVESPLVKYSLLGQSAAFEANAVKAEPLLGEIALAGQLTVLYAPPNVGKTLGVLGLLTDAVTQGRINPANVFYINADDSSEGFAVKLGLMDDLGVHTLAPGHQGFEPGNLLDLFHTIAAGHKAKNTLVVIDTLKKFTSLMEKSKASEFTDACRRFSMSGGSVVGLAHTNKSPSLTGKLQYGGTTDLRDDFDAAYIISPVEQSNLPDDKVINFECIKSRGGNAQSVFYAYAAGSDVSYAMRLASFRRIDEGEYDGFQRFEAEKGDSEIVAAIEAAILEGDFAKMALGKLVAKRTGVSGRAAMRVIEAYSGTDPATHKWTFVRKNRGAMIFTLLDKPEESSTDLAT